MASDIITKEYTRVVDNSEKIESNVWKSLRQHHDIRTEELSQCFFQTGPEKKLKNKVLSIIHSAKNMLVLSSFLFADQELKTALIEAAREGVNIYFLLAATARLDQEPDADSEFDQRVYREHKEMLKEITPYVYIRSADHFHAKVIVADPFTDMARGVLLTANLTTEALERNEELGFVLSQKQARVVGEILRYIFWEEAAHHAIASDNAFSSIHPLQAILPPETNSGVYFNSNGQNTLKARTLQLIDTAREEIILSTFGIEQDNEIFEKLINKLNQGIAVKLFVRLRRGKLNSVFEKLKNAGAVVYGFQWLHAKAFLIDQSKGFILTANFEQHGMDEGFELGIDVTNEEITALSRLFQEWEKYCQGAFYSQLHFMDLSKEYYRFEADQRQYAHRTIKEDAELPVEKISVQSESDLAINDKDFQKLIKKAQAVSALKVKIKVEKSFKPKKEIKE